MLKVGRKVYHVYRLDSYRKSYSLFSNYLSKYKLLLFILICLPILPAFDEYFWHNKKVFKYLKRENNSKTSSTKVQISKYFKHFICYIYANLIHMLPKNIFLQNINCKGTRGLRPYFGICVA